ncbi:hypothetical protein ACHAP3_002965 [Botrytis cinerea]
MFANNFKSASPNQTLVVHNQEQDPEEGYLSDSEDMVNLSELTAEQRLEIVELRRFQEERRLEIAGLHLEITRLHQQHHAEVARLHEERHLEITGPRLEINEGYLSDSEDMVNLSELTAEQRLEIVELRRFQEERRLENVGLHQQHHAEVARLHLEITELHQQHHAEVARLHLEITRLHREHHVEITVLSKPEILLAATVAAVLLVFAAGLLGTF